jgi:hypothetical protein
MIAIIRVLNFERPAYSTETLELLQKARAAFVRMALARAEIEAVQAARKARRRAQRPAPGHLLLTSATKSFLSPHL